MELTEKEKQFIAEVKKTRPSLKGIVLLARKYGFSLKSTRFKALFLENYLVKFLKKDKTIRRIHKNASRRINRAYKELSEIT